MRSRARLRLVAVVTRAAGFTPNASMLLRKVNKPPRRLLNRAPHAPTRKTHRPAGPNDPCRITFP